MISKEDLKNKLLKTDMFIDNISFNNYLDLIIKNLNTPKIKGQTQKHHIIPRYYFLDGGWNLGRSPRSIDSLKKGYNHEVKGMLGKAQSDYQKEQARKALFGKPKSDVAKNNMSLARKGKKLYIDPESGKGKYLSPDEIESYEKLGWSKK